MKKTSTLINHTYVAIICLILQPFSSVFAHWSTRGPYGGSVSCFAVIDTNVFLGSPTGGVYRSTNSQLVGWVYRNYNGLGSGKINALTSIGNKLIAATADSGIYISSNLGLNWTKSTTGLTAYNVTSLLTISGKILAGTNGNGIYMSTDSGTTWATMNNGLTNLVVNALAGSGDTLVAGTSSGVFTSINGGAGWTAANNGLTQTNIKTLTIMGTGVNTVLFAGTSNGVFRANASFTWTTLNTGLTNTNINQLMSREDSMYVYCATAQGVFLLYSNDSSWTPVSGMNEHVLSLGHYGNILLAGTLGKGIHRAHFASHSWSAVNTGFNNHASYAAAAKDSMVVLANELGVFVCKNFVKSAVYIKSNTGLTDSLHVNVFQISGNRIFAGTQNAGVFVSTDSGATWSAANTGLNNMAVTKMTASSAKIYVATQDGKIFSSDLNTISWNQINNGPIPVGALAATGDTIFAAIGSNIYFSIAGSPWSSLAFIQVTTSLALSSPYIFAGTSSGVYRKFLTGGTWEQVNNGLPSLHIQSLASVDAYIVAGWKGGAMTTCNQGNTWHNFNILEYIPNYSDVISFVHITPRIFALSPMHGLLGNGKAEFPKAIPDTPSVISGPSLFCYGRTVNFSVTNDPKANTYTWSLPSLVTGSSSAFNISALAVDSGIDTIFVYSSNGCGHSITRSLVIQVDGCTGIPNIGKETINIFPNPFREEINIRTNSKVQEITISDINGKAVKQVTVTGTETIVSTADLSKGIYLVQLKQNGTITHIHKMIKTE